MPTTFLDIINKTLERVDEDIANPDEQGLQVIKDGINQAYKIVKSSLDENTDTLTVPFSNEIVLSENVIRVVRVKSEYIGYINKSEYKKDADILYIFNRDLDDGEGDLYITYTKYPVALSGDDDTLTLREGLEDALTAFAAYRYMLSKRKYASAQLLLEEFKSYFGGGSTETNLQ